MTRTACGWRVASAFGWNTFPVPALSDQNKADLTRCAEEILLTREAHFPATIADLYDPDAMPADLRAAHHRNDETLERIYIGRRFKNDTERLEKLFEMYTEMTGKQKTGEKPNQEGGMNHERSDPLHVPGWQNPHEPSGGREDDLADASRDCRALPDDKAKCVTARAEYI